ncbi:MAG: DivIVA domain-containing protein [Actinomycetes bacterium]
MSLLLLLLAVLVVVAIAVVAAGHGDGLAEVTPDHNGAILPERSMRRADVDALHLSLAVRGYRTDEVDDVLDRLALELEERDLRIADLEQRLLESAPAASDAETGEQGSDADDVRESGVAVTAASHEAEAMHEVEAMHEAEAMHESDPHSETRPHSDVVDAARHES